MYDETVITLSEADFNHLRQLLIDSHYYARSNKKKEAIAGLSHRICHSADTRKKNG